MTQRGRNPIAKGQVKYFIFGWSDISALGVLKDLCAFEGSLEIL